jgi:hypothetical protein
MTFFQTRVSRFKDQTEFKTLALLVAKLLSGASWRHNGQGMLQAYLHEGEDQECRVHIWHPDLRRAGLAQSGAVHDHRFDMVSQVLLGTLGHTEYRTRENPDGGWEAWQVLHARAAAKVTGTFHQDPEALHERYHVDTLRFDFQAGQRYFFPKRIFHESHLGPSLAVTLVTKLDQESEPPARLLAPVGKPLVHSFSDPLPETVWRRYVEQAARELLDTWTASPRE